MGLRCKTFTLLLAASLLGGCGTSGTTLFTGGRQNQDDSTRDRVQKIDYTGIHPALERAHVEPLHLMQMLDPTGLAPVLYAQSVQRMGDPKAWTWRELFEDKKLEWAFEAFSRTPESDDARRLRRNRLQDRILISSEQRCGIYRRLLLEIQSDANFWLGTGATISGVLGPLFGERGAKNLSALAGIFSGTQAQVSQSYFYNLAVPVITKGIEERRKAVLDRIRGAQRANADDYSVQSAVRDAVYYDAQCSIIGGLEEAAEAIRLANDPGLDAANRTMLRAKVTRAIVSANTDQEIESLGKKVRDIESNPLMLANRFTQVGIPLAGVGASAARTPATAAATLRDHQLPPATTLRADDLAQVAQAHARAKTAGQLKSDAVTPTEAQIDAARKPLADALDQLATASAACVERLVELNKAFADADGRRLLESDPARLALVDADIAVLRASAASVQFAVESVRSDLIAARQDWRRRVDDGFAAGKTDVAAAKDAKPDLAEAAKRLQTLRDQTCRKAAG